MRDVPVAGVYKRIQRSSASRHCCERQWRPRANNARPCAQLARKKRNRRPGDCARASVQPRRLAKASYQSSNRTSCVFTWAPNTHTHTYMHREMKTSNAFFASGIVTSSFSAEAKGPTGGSAAPLRKPERGTIPSTLTFPRLLPPHHVAHASPHRHTSIRSPSTALSSTDLVI